MQKIKVLLSKQLVRVREGESVTLIRGVTGSFIVKITGAVLSFASQIFMARLLGVESYGNYIYVLAWINILVLIGKLGFDTASVRFIADYSARQEWGVLKGFLSYSTRVVLISSTSVGLGMSLGVWLARGYINPELLYGFLVAGLILPVVASLQVQQQRLRALQRVVLAQIPQQILLPLYILIGLGIITVVLEIKISATLALLIHLIAAIAALGIISLWFCNCLPPLVSRTPAIWKPKEWLQTASSLIFVTGLHLILYRTDTIMIGALASSSLVGLYAIAAKVASLLTIALVAVNSILAPKVAALYGQGLKQEIQKIITTSIRILLTLSILFAIAILFLGKLILEVFGQEFVESYPILLILTVGQFANVTIGPVSLLLNMTGYQDSNIKVLGISAVLNLVLNFVLVKNYGMIGAAIATSLIMVLWNLWLSVIVKSKLDISVLKLLD